MNLVAANPALTVGLALAAGVLAQGVARHLRIPGIVLLLAVGVLLGPDGLGVVQPDSLGPGLDILIGFAVAVILFEGGMNLKVDRLRRQGVVVRRLITLGAAVTLAGATLATHFILGWDWRLSILLGSLVIVTGPTVVTPLLRRVRVSRTVETILEAEGVLIDAIGAISAVVLLEVLVHPAAERASGATDFALRVLVGLAIGVLGGYFIAGALRWQRLVPEGLENIFALATVLALYQIGDAVEPESGIVAVTVSGLIVGNMQTRVSRELAEFKEQLTVLLIGLLFVLLAATVRVSDLRALGWPGVLTVATLMLVVRPLSVALCSWGSDLSWRERVFLGWVAPRGILAAAVATLFAARLDASEIEGGGALRAMVFLVIAITVLVHGSTMGPVARILRLRRPTNVGYVILGANGLGIGLGEALRQAGRQVVLIEANAAKANLAQELGLQVVFGNGLKERILLRARPDIRAGGIAVTPNEEANLLFARKLREQLSCPRVWVALDRVSGHLTPDLLHEAQVNVMFARPRDLNLWSLWLERGRAHIERWRYEGVAEASEESRESAASGERGESRESARERESLGGSPGSPGVAREPLLPLLWERKERALPYDETVEPREGDAVYFAIDGNRQDLAQELLHERGWESDPADAPG